jgi:hypothetical protein
MPATTLPPAITNGASALAADRQAFLDEKNTSAVAGGEGTLLAKSLRSKKTVDQPPASEAIPVGPQSSSGPDLKPKPFVFVLMPFDEAFRDIYELGIKEACRDAGAYSERVDEQRYEGTILERIYNQVAKADLIVSDMSGRNPNVFYETGYAHALQAGHLTHE